MSLAFQPTSLIAVNKDLALPEMDIHVGCKASTFAYLPALTAEKKEEVSKVPTAVLSTTAKAKERAKKKEAAKKAAAGETGASMEVDTGNAASTSAAALAEGGDASKAAGDAAAADAAVKKDEPTSYTAKNPCRVVTAQLKHLSVPAGSRWTAVKSDFPLTGVMVVKDNQPGEPVQLVANSAQGVAAAAAATAAATAGQEAAAPAAQPAAGAAPGAAQGGDDDEPPPPAPFEYTPAGSS